MKLRLLFFLSGCFLMTLSAFAQNATIDTDFKITVSQVSSNSTYIIDIGSANFANEQKAREVFNYYERHPLLNFDLNYADSEVLMKVRDLTNISQGTIDLNYLNGILQRRSAAYQRKF